MYPSHENNHLKIITITFIIYCLNNDVALIKKIFHHANNVNPVGFFPEEAQIEYLNLNWGAYQTS